MVGFDKTPLVSIIVVTYNSQEFIGKCLTALSRTDYSKFEVIMVDNGSSDNAVDITKKKYPEVKLVVSKENLGYAGGNNLGAKRAKGKLLAIINPDTVVSEDWLNPLVDKISNQLVGVCQPKILLSQNKKLINCSGKTTHFLGFEWLSDYKRVDYQMETKEIGSFSGSAFLIKKEIFDQLGGFDDDFFMYMEDGDLSWRLRLMGYKILFVPESVVYHDYKYQPKEDYQRAKDKFYYLERNRMMMLLKNYSLKTWFLVLPAFLVMEIGMNFYFITAGFGLGKIKGYFQLFKNFAKITGKRQVIQKNRKLMECDLVKDFVGKINFEEFDNFLLRHLANPFLDLYWRIARSLI